MTGGPYWTCAHNGIWIHTVNQVLTARALEGLSDGGVTNFIVPSCELRYAPGAPGSSPGVPHSDETSFSDDSLYDTPAVTGEVVAPAALRATTLLISIDGGAVPQNDFSILHPVKDHRRYRVVKVVDIADGVATVLIRPPLREEVTGGEALEFEHPKCLMTLANAADFLGALELGRFADANPQFVEAF